MNTVHKKIIDTFNDNPQVFTDRDLPIIRTIDINLGQPDAPEDFEVFYPAIFYDWSIKSDPNKVDPDMLTLDFHIIADPTGGTENFSEALDEGLQYISIIKAVKYCLNQLRADNTTPFRYLGERPNATPYFKYTVVSYQCNIDSYTDSLHRTHLVTAKAESITIAKGHLKTNLPNTIAEDTLSIDVMP